MTKKISFHTFRKLILVALPLVLSALMIAACAEPKKDEKDPFFEKWQAMALEAKGHSPAPPPEYGEELKPSAPISPVPEAKPEVEKPLPKKKISLKMNNIDVAVLLRALARAADQNIILNEKVTGRTNININQAPWDQVFLGILNTHNLWYTWEGSIIRIMTADDMEDDLRRRARQNEMQTIEPHITRIVPIKYSQAERLRDNLEKFLSQDKDGKPIGSILVDQHTNSVIIQAIRRDTTTILAVISKLDKPTPQVLIEAQIVEANKDVARELGVQWGGVQRMAVGGGNLFVGGDQTGTIGANTVGTAADAAPGAVVTLPADPLSGFNPMTLGFLFQNVGNTLLTAQLSALQEQGKLNILSSPSITTLDNQEAVIKAGRDVPFQSVEDGEVKVEYKEAVLSLVVTPHVIDKNTLKMSLKVNKDEPDFSQTVLGNPTIIKREAITNVIQFDGETIVIGGLSKETSAKEQTGVPWLEDIPGVGLMFKKKGTANQLEDLLIFITPHILKPPPS